MDPMKNIRASQNKVKLGKMKKYLNRVLSLYLMKKLAVYKNTQVWVVI